MATRPRSALLRPALACVVLLALLFGLAGFTGGLAPERGPDLAAGTRLTFTAPEGATEAELRRSAEVMARRLDSADLPGARVRLLDDEILVAYPGEPRPALTAALTRPGVLGIRVVARSGSSAAGGLGQQDPSADGSDGEGSGGESSEEPAATEYGEPLVWSVNPDTASLSAFDTYRCGAEGDVGADASVAEADRPLLACDDLGVKYLLSPVVVDGDRLSDASARVSPGTIDWGVRLRFDRDGTDAFSAMSRVLSGTQRQFAVVLDDRVVSAPRMTTPVTTGEANISGNLTEAAARGLATSLDAGTLPLEFDDPTTAGADAPLDGRTALLMLLAGLGVLVALGLAGVLRFGRIALALPAGLLLGAGLAYVVVVLLGQRAGLVLSPATVAALIAAPAMIVHHGASLLSRVSAGVGTGQSARAVAPVEVRRSRNAAAWAAALPGALAVVLVLTAGGTLRQFAVTLLVSVAVSLVAHVAVTAALVGWLSEGPDPARGLATSPVGIVARRRLGQIVAGVAAAVALIGLVVAGITLAPGVTGPGESSGTWLLIGLLVVAALAIATWGYRFSWQVAVAGTVGVAVTLLVVVGLSRLLGITADAGPVAALIAVGALALRGAVADLLELEEVMASRSRRPLAESIDLAVERLFLARRTALLLLAAPLLVAIALGTTLGGVGPLVDVAVVLLLGVVLAPICSILVSLPLLVDLPGRGLQPSVTRVAAAKPAAPASAPSAKPTSKATGRKGAAQQGGAKPKAKPQPPKAARGPVTAAGSAGRQQPSRQSRSKRAKKR